jgi:hypothetical protein
MFSPPPGAHKMFRSKSAVLPSRPVVSMEVCWSHPDTFACVVQYFSKFCLAHLCPTQVKGARAIVVLLSSIGRYIVHLVDFMATKGFLFSRYFLDIR